ncbi:unnamed protein product, partial [Iphiclides podalirius]
MYVNTKYDENCFAVRTFVDNIGRSGRLLPRGCCAGASPEAEVTGAHLWKNGRSELLGRERQLAIVSQSRRLSFRELMESGLRDGGA